MRLADRGEKNGLPTKTDVIYGTGTRHTGHPRSVNRAANPDLESNSGAGTRRAESMRERRLRGERGESSGAAETVLSPSDGFPSVGTSSF